MRLDEGSRAQLLAIAGAKRFEPMAGRPMAEYVVVPKRRSEEGSEAKTWIAKALNWTANLPAKVGRSKAAVKRRR